MVQQTLTLELVAIMRYVVSVNKDLHVYEDFVDVEGIINSIWSYNLNNFGTCLVLKKYETNIVPPQLKSV